MTNHEFKEKLISSLSNTTVEIRFVKEQQIKTAYYFLLLFAAIIGAFQIDVSLSKGLHKALRIIAMLAVGCVGVISIIFQCHHSKALMEYREGLKDSEAVLAQKKKRNWLYMGFLDGLTVLGAIAAGIVIWFDK